MPSLIYSGFTEGANSLTSATYSVVFLIVSKKTCGFGFISQKIRVGRWEKMVLVVFCWAIFSRVPTSILTRDV